MLHARSPPDDAQPGGRAEESQIANFVIRRACLVYKALDGTLSGRRLWRSEILLPAFRLR